MGVTLQDVAQGALDLGRIIQNGMTAIDQATGQTAGQKAATSSGTPQPAAPGAASSTAVTQSPATGAAMALPQWALPVGVGVLLLWWKPWRKL